MTKAQLEASLVECGMNRKQAVQWIENFLQVVEVNLSAGGACTLPGIGTLKVVSRASRKGRNPKTGEPLDIEAKRAVTFRACKALREAVQ